MDKKFYRYPFIGNTNELRKQLAFYSQYLPDVLQFTGRVKVHGTHGDIRQHEDGSLTVQSRNRIITQDKDNFDFAKFVESRSDAFANIFEAIRIAEGGATEVMISGEYCGKNIQSGVAVNALDRFFIIYSVFANGKWHEPSPYMCSDRYNIFSIASYPELTVEMKKDDVGTLEKTCLKLANRVAESCPIGKAMGVEGLGEGIVWKCNFNPAKSDLWFLTKAETFVQSNTKEKVTNVKLEYAKNFAEGQMTEELMKRVRAQCAFQLGEYGFRDFLRAVMHEVFKVDLVMYDPKQLHLCRKEATKLAFIWINKHIHDT